MLSPRNTLVIVKLVEKKEAKVGNIVVPDAETQYCEAEVMAVGPGTAMNTGERSLTFDLKQGQRVFLRYKEYQQTQMGRQLMVSGVKYIHDGQVYYIYEQMNVFGIIAEPGNFVPSDLTDSDSSSTLETPTQVAPASKIILN